MQVFVDSSLICMPPLVNFLIYICANSTFYHCCPCFYWFLIPIKWPINGRFEKNEDVAVELTRLCRHAVAAIGYLILVYRSPLNQSTMKSTMEQPSYRHRTSIYTVGFVISPSFVAYSSVVIIDFAFLCNFVLGPLPHSCQTLVFNLNRRLLNTCHWCWRSREVIRIQPSSSFRVCFVLISGVGYKLLSFLICRP